MKKNTGREMILILVLLILVLLCLIGFVFLRHDQKKQSGQIKDLKEEIQVLEGKRAQMIYDREELEMKQDAAAEDTENNAENNEEQASEGNGEEVSALPDEGTQAPVNIDTVRESIQASISRNIAAGETWQVYVCRLSDQAEETVGSGRMTAASLIKLYIMGAVYENYDAMTTQNGKEYVDELLRSMITVSDNNAANALTGMLGGGDAAAGRAAVSEYCSRNGYMDSDMGRMLLETGTDRENYTSVKDCGMFLKRIYQGELPHGEDMMNLLKQQERRGKIPVGVPQGVEVANKTGELDRVENDAAVVFKDNCPYILCIMSENINDAAAARQTIINISAGVYNNL